MCGKLIFYKGSQEFNRERQVHKLVLPQLRVLMHKMTSFPQLTHLLHKNKGEAEHSHKWGHGQEPGPENELQWFSGHCGAPLGLL